MTSCHVFPAIGSGLTGNHVGNHDFNIFTLINYDANIMKSTGSLQHFGFFSLPQLSAVRRKRFPRQNPSEVLNAEIPAATWSD